MLTLLPAFGPATGGVEYVGDWTLGAPAGGRLATLWACADTAAPARIARLRTVVFGEYRISIGSIHLSRLRRTPFADASLCAQMIIPHCEYECGSLLGFEAQN